MKRILFVFFLLISSVFSFAEGLSGFNGIPFGTSMEKANEIMNEKGWGYLKQYDKYMGGIYGGTETNGIKLSYYKNRLYCAYVKIPGIYEENAELIISTQKQKYNLEEELVTWNSDGLRYTKYTDKTNGNWIYAERKPVLNMYYYEIWYMCDEIYREKENDKKIEEQQKLENEQKLKQSSFENDL